MMDLDAQFFESTLEGGYWVANSLKDSVKGFSQDSRTLRPGDCFVALKTEQRDGHDFLDDAQHKGAIAALVSNSKHSVNIPCFVVENPIRALQALAREHRRRFRGPVVGITGSAGKTSTRNMLTTLLGEGTCATPGNFNNTLGLPLSVLRLENSHLFGVFEAGIDRPGEMNILSDVLWPDIGIVTLIAEAHLDRLSSLDGVAQEKVKLLQNVRPEGLAIFSDRCLQYKEFRDLGCDAWVVTQDTALNLESVRQTRVPYWTETTDVYHGGVRLCIAGPVRSLSKFDLPSMSRGMRDNTTLSILAAQRLGVSDEQIQERIARWRAPEQRGQWFAGLKRNVYVDCYNANPASMLDSARFFDESTRSHRGRVFVLGTMNELGANAEELHSSVAKSLPIRSGDAVHCVGEYANALASGIREKSDKIDVLAEYPDVQSLRSKWVEFTGAVFLKGSRSLRLEALLDQELRPKGKRC